MFRTMGYYISLNIRVLQRQGKNVKTNAAHEFIRGELDKKQNLVTDSSVYKFIITQPLQGVGRYFA